LATLSFVSTAANVILLGPPGVGKTHMRVSTEKGAGVLIEKGARARLERVS
ncbi:MAG: ATP-binding protein, partial [Firmicutes bacterium]|nr:ATP-binding protein [Bacillota bacterium]